MFTTSDPLNRKVTLKRETWENKIINTTGSNNNKEHGNSHEDMASLVGQIKNTIEKPSIIVKDTSILGLDDNGEEIICESANREEYFGIYINTTDSCLNGIKIVVEFNTDIGEVVTTHRMNGKLSKIKVKGGVVYEANKQ